MNKRQLSLLVFSLAIVFVLVYSPHFNYRYPLHADEWQHSARIIDAMENGYSQVNPYFIDRPYYPNFEPGFTLSMAGFFYLTGLDVVLTYKYFAASFAAVAALFLFMLVYRLSNFYSAILSVLFFSMLKSNINILGLWFFTPLTMAIPFFFFLLFMFVHLLEKKFSVLLFILIFISLFFIHPITAIFLFLIILMFLLFHSHYLASNKRILLFFIMPLPFLAYLFITMPYIELKKLILDWLIIEKNWGYVELPYFLPKLYGIIPSLLAVIGLPIALRDKKKRIFIIASAITFLLILIFNIFEFSILLPYQRVVYYAMLSLVPLSAFGLFHIVNNIKWAWIKIILVIVVFLTIGLNYEQDPLTKVYYPIAEDEYNSIKFLEQFNGSIVMSPLSASSAVYPVSRNYVVGFTKSIFLGGSQNLILNFYNNNCDYKRKTIDAHKVNFVLSGKNLSCSYLDEVYNGGFMIYAIKKDN